MTWQEALDEMGFTKGAAVELTRVPEEGDPGYNSALDNWYNGLTGRIDNITVADMPNERVGRVFCDVKRDAGYCGWGAIPITCLRLIPPVTRVEINGAVGVVDATDRTITLGDAIFSFDDIYALYEAVREVE